MSENNYPIGTQCTPWNDKDKQCWFNLQTIKRSYQSEVVTLINELDNDFEVEQYGALSFDPTRYPLFIIKSKQWASNKPSILITGGVHGYETSGVHGALHFMKTLGMKYAKEFNLLVAPCISPWGYETINRWNPAAIDPNRSFYSPSPAPESAALINYIKAQNIPLLAHIDLHETTDTDNSEFRPALAARDGKVNTNWNIPDGFYLVADSNKPEAQFQKAIIDTVANVTQIAPSDENNQLIGVPLEQHGVINYAARELGLCMGFTNAQYVTTTEVYPDSPTATDELCITAQVAAIKGALDHLLTK
ncbi:MULTISPECIES: M14 family metallocarboxypeptidase [unclassified Pseudoalteromonas]|uniref:M14 family metallopeptidase n=1 Tax=unclassified Pseudoalteromonas TaxID=194690 RepID=UPI0016039B5D|nr:MULTISPECIES: M14 family metallocarboxypeptidase [unclassified Pseudoalteromonas]MBB1308317.1 M14 family metallocarboxypeptidase [Pseudoalteromonas sp. SR41-8]MBB1408974.1 M14 family metallocarboxypeptidase [Pseudoalteromonas sp. SG44-17]